MNGSVLLEREHYGGGVVDKQRALCYNKNVYEDSRVEFREGEVRNGAVRANSCARSGRDTRR